MWVKEGKGLVVWLCGLAGSGKSTLGKALYEAIKSEIPNVVYLDGDELRELLGHFEYDKQGRIEVALKRSKFAHFLSSQGLVVVVTTISLFDEIYKYNRETLQHYLEVYVECSLEELQRRDQKGLYSGALKGIIQNVVGVDIPFVEPNADIILQNSSPNGLEQKVQDIFNQIEEFLSICKEQECT
ncbi:adenylyl-sulfate kinase [Helicobacter sp. MIT 05-5294]|uniref:adenylyl-sulfate kinase n=1 Tax=Helicobacter sp. MIT 05-5294 TaxID=1548150 RepID=UPI0010FD6F2C|nr:adenylyl-sulfate kinase [Helicobacter sp. MIT 05-5294]TLD88192.1 adenylyl-sulfate kinase [Helicobacter sp. MIT 05-5294]